MIHTELTDITFRSKQGEISLASFDLHVENQGVNSIFMLPSYRNINIVNWQEYDGEDIDSSTASVNALQMPIKVFGTAEAVESLVAKLSEYATNDEIIVACKITEGTFKNSINFSTRYVNTTIGKAVIVNDWRLEHFLLTDQDSNYIANEAELLIEAGIMMKKLKHIAFATITFSRCDNNEYFGLLADNTRACIGIPQTQFTYGKFPNTNMPIIFKRYHLSNREATEVDTFELDDLLVYCYPLKGIMQGLTQIASAKDPFVVQTENMVGEVTHTHMANKRKAKTISVPLLIRSHSVSAIFAYLGKYKTFVHETLKSNDMLYLCAEKAGDYAVYPTGCSIQKAYIKDIPWVQLTLQFTCYKEGFDFTAETDEVPDDNPEPVLPPSPSPTFDPYKNINKSGWEVCTYGNSITNKYLTLNQVLVYPDSKTTDFGYTWQFNNAKQGWSVYAKAVNRYPVGTLFFAQKLEKAGASDKFVTVVALPTSKTNLESVLAGLQMSAILNGYTQTKMTLVGVVQGCDVLSKNIVNWETQLSEKGGLVGSGSVRVHSDIKTMADNQKFLVASGLTLSAYADFDTLVNNIKLDIAEDELKYYTSWGVSLNH